MTKDDIIRMGLEANLPAFIYPNLINEIDWARMEHFVSLVYAEAHQHGLDDFEATILPIAIANEREACAKVASSVYSPDASNYPNHIAAAIRARGNT